ncbi:uncharacterized protein LOC115224772 [Argonauta hians]
MAEQDERKLMEQFVRQLFSKTDDFNLLTKKIVRKQYLQYSKRNCLNPEQKTILTDVIIKLLFEFNVGKEKSAASEKNDPGGVETQPTLDDSGGGGDGGSAKDNLPPKVTQTEGDVDGDADGDGDSRDGGGGGGERKIDGGGGADKHSAKDSTVIVNVNDDDDDDGSGDGGNLIIADDGDDDGGDDGGGVAGAGDDDGNYDDGGGSVVVIDDDDDISGDSGGKVGDSTTPAPCSGVEEEKKDKDKEQEHNDDADDADGGGGDKDEEHKHNNDVGDTSVTMDDDDDDDTHAAGGVGGGGRRASLASSKNTATTTATATSKRVGARNYLKNVRVIAMPSTKELAVVQATHKAGCAGPSPATSPANANSDASAADGGVGGGGGGGEGKPNKPALHAKRLSAFDVLKCVLDDSSDAAVSSLHSEEDGSGTHDTEGSAIKTAPHCKRTPFSLLSSDSQDVRIPVTVPAEQPGGLDGGPATKTIMVTPSRKRRAAGGGGGRSKRPHLEPGDLSSDSAFTPPAKVKLLAGPTAAAVVVSDSSESNNSPIRIRLFRNRIVSNTLVSDSKARKSKKFVADDSDDGDVDSPAKSDAKGQASASNKLEPRPESSPVLLASESEASDDDDDDSKEEEEAVPVGGRKRKQSSKQVGSAAPKGQRHRAKKQAPCDDNQKTVKPFKISLLKKEILKGSEDSTDSNSDFDTRLLNSVRHKTRKRQKTLPSSSSSSSSKSSSSESESDDLKLSQIKLLNSQASPSMTTTTATTVPAKTRRALQSASSSSDSEEELLINFAVGGTKHHLTAKDSNTKPSPIPLTTTTTPPGRTNSTAAQLKIIREKGLYSSESENDDENLATPLGGAMSDRPRGSASVGKIRIIRENMAINSESDNAIANCDKTTPRKITPATTLAASPGETTPASSPLPMEVTSTAKTGCNGQAGSGTDSDDSRSSPALSSSSSSPSSLPSPSPVKKSLKNQPAKTKKLKKAPAGATSQPSATEESSQLKLLRKICNAAQIFVNYKREFQDLKTDKEKCERLKGKLKEAGMEGRPSLKAAKRVRLLREASELNKDNIISHDSGRTRRKRKDFFSVSTSPLKTVQCRPNSDLYENLKGIVDSERSESDQDS